MINVSKISHAKNAIGNMIKKNMQKNEPFDKIVLDLGIEQGKYEIVIEAIEKDFYIDSKGNKWVKEKNV